MPRGRWTTADQFDWLEAQMPLFEQATENDATANFYKQVRQGFWEKWPLLQVTQTEIDKAGSLEKAEAAMRMKTNARLSAWFHNHSRDVDDGKPLEIKGKPRLLHSWQAYSSLTYESQWKREVDKVWAAYKRQWEQEHPKEKPEKSRFTIMTEFMKEKLANETPEMKAKVEEHRQRVKKEAESPAPVGEDSDEPTKRKILSAIEALPRTLKNVGNSILNQTGWNVTVMVGGRMPDDDQLTTYLAHFGTTNDGKTFEKFLGPSDYETHLLEPFDRFLNACFKSKGDDSSRKPAANTVSSDADGQSTSGDRNSTVANMTSNPKESNTTEGGGIDVNGDQGGQDKEIERDDEDGNDEHEFEGGPNNSTATVSASGTSQKSEYEIRREKNIAENKAIMAALKAKYPIENEGVELKQITSNAPKKKVSKTPSGIKQNDTSRRVSARLNSASTSTSIDVNQQISDQQSDATPFTSPSGTTSATSSDAGQVGSLPPAPTIPTPNETLVDSLASRTTTTTNVQTTVTTIPNPTNLESARETNGDVAMKDATGDGNQGNEKTLPASDVDEKLPGWLSPMVDYLRQISTDGLWQGLITEFLLFEKSGPPTGKLPTKFRPEPLAAWIRSKKKTVIPPLNRDKYYAAYTEWYNSLQPAWRIQEDGQGGKLRLSRDAPQGETWQILRKGGSAGIYFVIMGLSWWLYPEASDRDRTAYADAWMIVEDLHWIIQQMTKISDPEMSRAPKRAQEPGDDDEDSTPSTSRRRIE